MLCSSKHAQLNMLNGATADSHPLYVEGIMTNSIDVEYLGNGPPKKVTNVERIRQQGDSDDDGVASGAAGSLISFISMILIVITFPVSLIFCLKIVQEYERAVIFRLGRVKKSGTVGPGIFFFAPCLDQVHFNS